MFAKYSLTQQHYQLACPQVCRVFYFDTCLSMIYNLFAQKCAHAASLPEFCNYVRLPPLTSEKTRDLRSGFAYYAYRCRCE